MENKSKFIKKIQEKGIKHIIEETIPWFLNDIFDKYLFRIIKKIYMNKPLEDIIIIESHNDFDSNGGAFFDYLIKNEYNKKYKIVWFLRNKCPKNLPENVEGYRYNRLSIKRNYYYCVAKYIVCGHYMIPSIREGQKSYFTTHGAFSLKAFKGNVNIPNGIDYILTPSDYLKAILADGYMIDYPNKRQITIGFPLHDVLYNKENGDLKKLTNKIYSKIILWMPTFRKSVDGRNDSITEDGLGIPIIKSLNSYQKLNDKLNKYNVLLIIKIHPMQDMREVKIDSLSNIKVLDGKSVKKLKIDNYRLMKDTDALISDYSSSAYDYLHLDRPIGYTMDDADNYKLGFLVDNPKEFMAGNIIYDFDDFNNFISEILNNEDRYKEKRRLLFGKIWKYRDGNSCERLVDHMGIKK